MNTVTENVNKQQIVITSSRNSLALLKISFKAVTVGSSSESVVAGVAYSGCAYTFPFSNPLYWGTTVSTKKVMVESQNYL